MNNQYFIRLITIINLTSISCNAFFLNNKFIYIQHNKNEFICSYNHQKKDISKITLTYDKHTTITTALCVVIGDLETEPLLIFKVNDHTNRLSAQKMFWQNKIQVGWEDLFKNPQKNYNLTNRYSLLSFALDAWNDEKKSNLYLQKHLQ